MAHLPPPRPVRCPSDGSPPRGTSLRDNLAQPQGTPPRLAPHRTRTRRPCPPPPPRPPERRNTDPFDKAELRAVYDIHANIPLSGLVAALREHLQDVHPNRIFAVVPLPHAATTDIFVRQHQALVNPGMQIVDELVHASIWWFKAHQPDQGGVWVPHLSWAHTLIAPMTDPGPAPSTGGRERAAPQPRANTLEIPPYKDLAEQESRTAPGRGRNLRELVERYPPGAEAACAGPRRREDDTHTISMIMLESGHYYQVRITPPPQECHWNLEAVDSMLPARAALPDGPTPLPQNEPPDPLTAIVSGEAGTWYPGHALYCLWRWAQRRKTHTRDWTATQRVHLDGRQQLEAITQRERTAESPAATNLCPVFVIHQIRALAIGGQLQPAIRTETEAQASHTVLVHEILSALRSALVRRVENPPGP